MAARTAQGAAACVAAGAAGAERAALDAALARHGERHTWRRDACAASDASATLRPAAVCVTRAALYVACRGRARRLPLGAVAGLALSPLPDGLVALRCGQGRAFDELLAVDDKMGLCAALASARRAEVHAAVGAEDAALLGIATDVPLDVSERFAFRPAANARAEVHARANEGGVSVRIRLLGEGHADQPAESAQETRHEGRRRDA